MGGKVITGSVTVFVWSVWLLTSFAQEYCEDEAFKGECNENEAIIIDRAEYGRMRAGRCIGENAVLGCSVDVQTQLDRRCSGHSNCEVKVTSFFYEGTKPCPKDYRSYLEASYTCIPVIQAKKEECYGPGPIKIPAKSGYISSMVTRQTGCGSLDIPWLIEVDPGQGINVTLMDFSMFNKASTSTDKVCMVYATIKEASGGQAVAKTICGGMQRIQNVFTSVTRALEVRIVSPSKQSNKKTRSEFIIKFEPTGCPDVEPPSGGWVRRDLNTATVGCTATDDKWQLTCKEQKWFGADLIGSCPPEDLTALNSAKSLFPSASIPNSMSIVIVVGIALVVGLCILLVGLLCLRRQRLRAANPRYAKAGKPRSANAEAYHTAKCPPAQEYFVQNGENDYYRTWQLQQRRGIPAPPPGECPDHPMSPAPAQTYNALSTDSSFSAQNGSRYSEHLYESPKFDRHDIVFSEDGGNAKYFELDPEIGPGNSATSRDYSTGGNCSSSKTDASMAPKR